MVINIQHFVVISETVKRKEKMWWQIKKIEFGMGDALKVSSLRGDDTSKRSSWAQLSSRLASYDN